MAHTRASCRITALRPRGTVAGEGAATYYRDLNSDLLQTGIFESGNCGHPDIEEQEQHGLFTGKRSLSFGPPAKLLVDPFQRVGGPQRFPLRGWESGEGEEFVTGLLEADADRLAAQCPLAQEANARLLDSLAARSIDHPPIILGEFFTQMRRRLGQQIPQLMISAALNRERGPLH